MIGDPKTAPAGQEPRENKHAGGYYSPLRRQLEREAMMEKSSQRKGFQFGKVSAWDILKRGMQLKAEIETPLQVERSSPSLKLSFRPAMMDQASSPGYTTNPPARGWDI